MSRDTISVTEDTNFGDLARLLSEQRRQVPVLRGSQVVGIISRSDVARQHAAAVGSAPPSDNNPTQSAHSTPRETPSA